MTAEATASPARVTKVLVVVVGEIQPARQLRSAMPYTYSQATRYGYAARWSAVSHRSLPNYLAIVSGTTHGIRDDGPPAAHPLPGRTVFGQARAVGRTAKTYLGGMPSRCRLTSTGRYAVEHNPWAYFTRERGLCRSFSRSTARLAADSRNGTLPHVGLVVPARCPGTEGCPPGRTDAWVRSVITRVKAGPDWKAGRLAVVLTGEHAAAGGTSAGGRVLTVVLHPSLSGRVVRTPLTHYSLTRFVDDVLRAPRLGGAATAPDLAVAFGLRVDRPTRAAAPTTAPKPSAPHVTETPPLTTPPLTTPPAPPPPPSDGDGVQAAVLHGWGPVVAGDEFDYTGAPDPLKWWVYNAAGHGGNGLRRPSAWFVDGSVATVTGDENGTTGGMAAWFGRRQYGRWEVRMRTNDRDKHYHPVAILWPDQKPDYLSVCPEIDYAEASADLTQVHFFLHHRCGAAEAREHRVVDLTQWHNFAVEWTPSAITGYLDGEKWFENTDPTLQPPATMHQTLQLDWFPDDTPTTTVSTMSVDWVRVYDLG